MRRQDVTGVAVLGVDAAARQVREAAEHAAMAARLARDLPRFVRTPIGAEAARERVRAGVEQRERRFLALLERAVYGHAASPYRALLGHAGCEFGDLRALVARDGLDGALETLMSRGVYVTFDEFKGRRPIVRGSARFTVSDRDFDNPLATGHYAVVTGGSGGRPARVARSLGAITDGATSLAVALDAFGVRNPRAMLWIGASPTLALMMLKLGLPIDAWFYPIHPLPRFAGVGLGYVSMLARLGGRRVPTPLHCDLQEPGRITRWLAERARPDRPVLVSTRISSAVRIAAAAADRGASLDGVTFYCRSEPFTDARKHQIERSGARALPDYSSVELASMAFACPHAIAADDVHLLSDRFALIQRERPIVEHGPTVQALLLTSLSLNTPKIALNAELGDLARVEQRTCGCPLEGLGLRTHLSEIRSFEKLSSEGSTFARSGVLQILEEVLPSRFGGTPLDYQLVEQEAPDSTTVLVLRIHPRVGPLDEAALRTTLLEELRRGGLADEYHARLIERAEAVAVRRLPPYATEAGKILPFQLLRVSQRA